MSIVQPRAAAGFEVRVRDIDPAETFHVALFGTRRRRAATMGDTTPAPRSPAVMVDVQSPAAWT